MGAVVARRRPRRPGVGRRARPLSPSRRSPPRGALRMTIPASVAPHATLPAAPARPAPIPLVDLAVQHRQVAAEVDAGLGPRAGRGRRSSSAPTSSPSRRSSPGSPAPSTASAWPTAPTPSSWRCAPAASGAGDEVVAAGQHVHRHRRGGQPHRRSPGAGRLRSRAPARRPRRGQPRRSPGAHGRSSPSTCTARWPRSTALAARPARRASTSSRTPPSRRARPATARAAAASAPSAATSFYPGKNLGAYGDAGAVLTERRGDGGHAAGARARTAAPASTSTTGSA